MTTDKYPLRPRGSQVLRILDSPSGRDGQSTDHADLANVMRFVVDCIHRGRRW